MLCDKVGAIIFKASYLIGKFLGLVSIEYDSKKKTFINSITSTLMSTCICIFIAVISPFVVKWNSEIYLISGVHIDENMSLITATQFAFGYATSFIVLLCQLWQRKNVRRSANDFHKVLSKLAAEPRCSNIISLELIFLIAMKFSITMYEVLINFPYLIEYGDIISAKGFVAFFLNIYIAEIAAVFSDVVFATLLLLARFLFLVDEQLKSLNIEMNGVLTQSQMLDDRRRMIRMTRLYLQMKGMVAEFSRCIEISILVQMLNQFANMLSNLYALLDFFAQESILEKKDLVYNVMIFLNICLLIYAAENVKRRSVVVKDTLLDLDVSRGITSVYSELKGDVLVFKIWPEVFEIDVLGMFSLDNVFLLFLISYSSNFIVIILQFEMTKLL